MLVVLNTTKYIIMTDVTARKSPTSSSFRSISANDAIMTNLSPAVALARFSSHQLTISPDTMDLACHSPSTVNLDAFNSPTTLYVLYSVYTLFISF